MLCRKSNVPTVWRNVEKHKTVSESIMRGLGEALDFARGEEAGAVVNRVTVPAVDVAAIRASTGLSQSAFARSIGEAKGTLLNWGREGGSRPGRRRCCWLCWRSGLRWWGSCCGDGSRVRRGRYMICPLVALSRELIFGSSCVHSNEINCFATFSGALSPHA